MSKTFKAAPTPKKPTPAEIAAFEAGPAPIAAKAPAKELARAELARLSVDLPVELHMRFKIACMRGRTKMTVELLEMIERRTIELESRHK